MKMKLVRVMIREAFPAGWHRKRTYANYAPLALISSPQPRRCGANKNRALRAPNKVKCTLHFVDPGFTLET